MTLLLHKLAFVGRASLQALHTKFFTLQGTSKIHVFPNTRIYNWHMIWSLPFMQKSVTWYDRILPRWSEGPNEGVLLRWGAKRDALNCLCICIAENMICHINSPALGWLINQSFYTWILLPKQHWRSDFGSVLNWQPIIPPNPNLFSISNSPQRPFRNHISPF